MAGIEDTAIAFEFDCAVAIKCMEFEANKKDGGEKPNFQPGGQEEKPKGFLSNIKALKQRADFHR